MLLAIDIGNTNIHMGLWHDNTWQLTWRARTVADKLPDEYAVLVQNFLSSAMVPAGEVTGVIIACVVPPLTLTFIELSQRYLGCDPIVVTNEIEVGMKIDIDQPAEAGADRIANAAAIAARQGGPAIVIDFGTATNFDIISSDNNYIGGALAPGIGITHDALVNRAARLHQIDLAPPPKPIGTNTIHALQSGIFWGYIGLVEGLTARIRTQLDSDETQVIATGGLANRIQQHTDVIDDIEPELTLNGLKIIYELNQ